MGQTIAGKYRVEKILGKGGMGVVLGARHLGLDEPVAIKVLKPAMMEVAGMVTRFLREARLASKIKSEHVARVTDVDTLDDGVPYMVMERLEGIDFSELKRQKGRFEVSEAVGYVLEVCEAIAEAHALGIVHRDLKPGNLFLHERRDGRRVVKVLDFGISKVDAPDEQDTTKTGQLMGSPKYMSPEQMTSMRDVDGRTDLWSLGAILFELVCGRPPFVAETTPHICAKVLNEDPPLPCSLRPDLPDEIEHVLLRCLEKEPDRRFADVASLVAALEPYAPVPELKSSGARAATAPASTRTETSIADEDEAPTVAVERAPVSAPSEATSEASVPAPRASVTPTSTGAATMASWGASQAPPARAPSRGLAMAVGAIALLGAAYGGYALRGGAEPKASPAATITTTPAPTTAVLATSTTTAPTTDIATTSTAAATSATVAAEPIKPAASASEVPEIATASPSKAPSVNAAAAKKPKAAPAIDPFGGRRN
ncbi:Serine/threonine-protein kinase pkn3 [Minicystis rosea]|nr:Serine/threonine-protein kinase pkn3 [Minicystis rosea]